MGLTASTRENWLHVSREEVTGYIVIEERYADNGRRD